VHKALSQQGSKNKPPGWPDSYQRWGAAEWKTRVSGREGGQGAVPLIQRVQKRKRAVP